MTAAKSPTEDPHAEQTVRMAGEPLDGAKCAMLMVHGRGARAEDILTLVDQLHQPGFAYLAPQAAGQTWYPNRFLVPIAENEPWLSSALSFVGRVFAEISNAGIPSERIMLLGFSQGACLTLEYAARSTRRYGGVVGLSGALIGPDGTPRNYPGSLMGTPVFLGCSDVDFHVPKERVDEAADVFRGLGGQVTERLYPGLDHSINQDEIDFVRGMMQILLTGL